MWFLPNPHCRMSLKCSGLYLAQFRFTSPHLLAGGDGSKTATIVDDVYIHPSAKVHPTAKASFPSCLWYRTMGTLLLFADAILLE